MPNLPSIPSLFLRPLRFRLRAQQPLWFSEGKAGNTLRGALGQSENFQCLPPLKPFVIRAAHLDGKYLKMGDRFHFDLHLFDLREQTLVRLIEIIESWASTGLGAARSQVELESISYLLQSGIEQPGAFSVQDFVCNLPEPLCLSLQSVEADEDLESVTVHFMTPTELKAAGTIVPVPSFAILIARIEERIRALCCSFGPVPFDPPSSKWIEQARQVRLVRSDLKHVTVCRRSSRTGQIHPIGGFLGQIEYAGFLTQYIPWLEAAYWTGVGRQTSWGKGAIRLSHNT